LPIKLNGFILTAEECFRLLWERMQRWKQTPSDVDKRNA
jgi:hypothetical protein